MLHLYNTLARREEEFKPIKNKRVGLYTCGPTVYNYAHLGNLRTYIFEDILKRVLVYNGYKVRHVMNITDVDDKTIRDSQAAKETLKHFTGRFTQYIKEDIKKLNILPPTKFAP
ncbi:MAG: cysteine--tRNA ligase, partial [Patescibacteria group bacterium]